MRQYRQAIHTGTIHRNLMLQHLAGATVYVANLVKLINVNLKRVVIMKTHGVLLMKLTVQ